MIGAIVLAAGASTRYGYSSKLLAGFSGQRVITRSLAALDDQPLRPVVIVTGRASRRVRDTIRRRPDGRRRYRFVNNADYRSGMAQSLHYGLQALPSRCQAALILLADMPNLERRTVARLCRLWRPGLDYVRPVCRGRPGHPVIVARRLFAELATLEGDQGAKAVLEQVPTERCRLIEAPPGCVQDVDTPTALRHAQKTFNRTDSENQTVSIRSSFMV
ncbi:nucleotidyltransferase family protein [uncultured Salinisphaera sp.]|uniref:nucleotidyltransferase family protein n=1 Tax=uncultured Salinisphaera sp. TaxID=359372 RepID=UPI0032B17417